MRFHFWHQYYEIWPEQFPYNNKMSFLNIGLSTCNFLCNADFVYFLQNVRCLRSDYMTGNCFQFSFNFPHWLLNGFKSSKLIFSPTRKKICLFWIYIYIYVERKSEILQKRPILLSLTWNYLLHYKKILLVKHYFYL